MSLPVCSSPSFINSVSTPLPSAKDIETAPSTQNNPFHKENTPINRLLAALFAKGHIDELGRFKADIANMPLPGLKASEVDSLQKFLEDPIIVVGKDNAFKVSFKLPELLSHLKSKVPEIEDIEIIGSSVPTFLPPGYLKRCFEALGLENIDEMLTPEVLQDFYAPPGDYDIRIILKDTYKDLPRDLSHEVINFIASKVYQTQTPQKDQIKEIKDKAFIKFKPYVDPHNYYFITSFGNRQDRNIDLLHVKTLRRRHLFMQDALGISVHEFTGTNPLGDGKLRVCSSLSGYQALLDRLTKSVRVREVNTINEYGFPLLISNMTKSRTCPEPNTIRDLRHKYLELLNDNKQSPLKRSNNPDAKQTVCESSASDRITKISNHLAYCIESHHRSDPVSAFALTVNACLLLEGALTSFEMKQLWQKMAPSFKSVVNTKAKQDDPDGLSAFLHALMSSEKIPFECISPLLRLRILLLENSPLFSRIRQEEKEYIQLNMLSKYGRPCIVFPLDLKDDCMAFSKYYQSLDKTADCATVTEIEGLSKHFSMPLSTSLQALHSLQTEQIASLEQLSVEWLEHPLKIFNAMGYPLLECCQHVQPSARTAALLIQHLPTALTTMPALVMKENLLAQVESLLQKASIGTEKGWETNLIQNLRHDLGNKNANDLSYAIVEYLGTVADPKINELALSLYAKLMEKNLPEENKRELSVKLIQNSAPHNVSFALHVFRHCQQKLGPTRQTQHNLLKCLLDHAPKQMIGNATSAPQILLLAESAILMMEHTITRKSAAKNKEPLANISVGLLWIVNALITQRNLDVGSKLLTAASEQSLISSPLQEMENLWITLCQAYLSSSPTDPKQAANLWKQGTSKHVFSHPDNEKKRQSFLICLIERLKESSQENIRESATEFLSALCHEQIDPLHKEKVDALVDDYFSGLAVRNAYADLAKALEGAEGSVLSSQQQFEFFYKSLEGQITRMQFTENDAGVQFKKILKLAKEETQLQRVSALFYVYCQNHLDNLPQKKSPEWHINQLRHVISDPKLAPLFSEKPEKKIEFLITCLELAFENKNKDPRSLIVELLTTITREAYTAPGHDMPQHCRLRLTRSLITGLSTIWHPTISAPVPLRAECSRILPMLVESIEPCNASQALDLFKAYDQHQIKFSLTESSSRICISRGLSILKETPQRCSDVHIVFSNLYKENNLVNPNDSEEAMVFHRTMANQLLTSCLGDRAIPWIERTIPSNNGPQPYRVPAEKFYQWTELLISQGQSSAAAKILSTIERQPAETSHSGKAPWTAIIESLHKQNPVLCAKIISENLAFIVKSDPERKFEKYISPLTAQLLSSNDSQTLPAAMNLMENFDIDDPDQWVELMKRIDSADKEKKQRLWELYKTKCDSRGIMKDTPQKRAQCWLSAIKGLSGVKTPSMEWFLDNPNEVDQACLEEYGMDMRIKACHSIIQWAHNHFLNNEYSEQIADKILKFKAIFNASLQGNNPRDACLAIELFSINVCLKCDSETMLLIGIQALDALMKTHESFSKSPPPKLLGELLTEVPSNINKHKSTGNKLLLDAIKSFYRTLSNSPLSLFDPLKMIECGIFHSSPEVGREAIPLLEAFLQRQTATKKNSDLKVISTSIKNCLSHCLGSDNEFLTFLAVRCLENPKISLVLTEKEICSIWFVKLSKKLTHKTARESVSSILFLVGYFEQNINKVNKDPEIEAKAINLALKLVSEILTVHNDHTQFTYITNRFMQWLNNPSRPILNPQQDESDLEMDLIHTELDNMLFEKTSSFKKMLQTPVPKIGFLPGSSRSKKNAKTPLYEVPINPQKSAPFMMMLIEILMVSWPKEMPTMAHVLQYTSHHIENLLDCNMISLSDYVKLVDKFAYAPMWDDTKMCEDHRNAIARLSYKGSIADLLRGYSESTLFKWMLLTDVHVNTQSLPGLKYKTYPNLLTPEKRANDVTEVISRLTKQSTHYSLRLAMNILLNTQRNILREFKAELSECYRLVILALITPPYCIEDQYDHYSLLTRCIRAIYDDGSQEMKDRASSFAYFFFQTICGMYCSNPFNFQHKEIDFAGYAWALFSNELIPFTVAGNLRQYLDLLQSFMNCVSANIVIRKDTLFQNHIPETLDTLYRSSASKEEKELVCNYKISWLDILAHSLNAQVKMEAIRLYRKWKIEFLKYPKVMEQAETIMAKTRSDGKPSKYT